MMMKWKSLLCVAAMLAAPGAGAGQQPRQARGTIPDNQVTVGSAPGGVYVVARSLKKKYDELVSRTKSLKARIVNQEIDEESARDALKQLKKELRDTAGEIEGTKKLVTVAKVHTTKTQLDFQLGPERNLVIVSKKVRLVGWDQPQVRCVLEKLVLSAGSEDVQEDLEGIRVVHRHGVSPDVVGHTEEESIRRMKGDAAELTVLQARLVREKIEKYAPFQAMQGRGVDVVEVSGLTNDQGNRQISMELRGDAGGSSWSEWRRHASLTVFVPPCKTVGIRGGREGVDIESLDGSLALVGEGDIDYSARSRGVNITGSLSAHNISLHVLDRIGGNVSLRRTAYQENAGSSYRGNSRTAFSGEPRPLKYSNIGGDLHLELTRADLRVESVSGRVDIRNDFGSTTFIATKPLAAPSHRFVSESGSIEIAIPKSSVMDRPFVAVTECGTVTCNNASRQTLEERNISSSTLPGPTRRSWKGFTSPMRNLMIFDLVDRISRCFSGEKGNGGFDVINRAGSVRLELSE